MIAGSAVPCSIQPRPRPSAARARCSPRPAVRASSAAAWKAARLLVELARLAVGLAEAEQQVAAGRVVGGLGELQGLERAVEVADGLLVGQRRQRPARRAGRVVDGLGRRSGLGGLDEVVGELAERRVGVAGVPLLEDRADPAMQTDAPGPAQRRVERLPNQRVGEGVAPRSTGFLLDDPALRGLLERLEHALARQLGKVVEHLDRERPADRGGHRHDAARRRRQRGQAPLDRLPHAVGYAELGERSQAPPLGPVDGGDFDQVAQDLLDEERVALGLAVKRVREMRRRRAPEPGGDHRRDLSAVQAPQPQPLDRPLAVQVREHGRPAARRAPYRGRCR